MIPIHKQEMPDKDQFFKKITKLINRGFYENNGGYILDFEAALQSELQTKHVIYTSSCTSALSIMCSMVEKSEIITTPFSFLATSHAIVAAGKKPIYVDIDSDSLNIDTSLIEDKITEKTGAILATHVFGNPCAIEELKLIADRNNILLLFDAASCFRAMYQGKPLANFGHMSALSFHATKILNTFEGGAVCTNSSFFAQHAKLLRTFGRDSSGYIVNSGLNHKNTELHAIAGLCNLKTVDNAIANRKKITEFYNQSLVFKEGIYPIESENFSYYPIKILNKKHAIDFVYEMNNNGIMARNYFSPALNMVFGDKNSCVHAQNAADTVVCLPIYNTMTLEESKKVVQVANDIWKQL